MRICMLCLAMGLVACSSGSSSGDDAADTRDPEVLAFEVDVTHDSTPEATDAALDAIEAAPDMTHDTTPEAVLEAFHDAADEVEAPDVTPDVPGEIAPETVADAPGDVPADVPVEAVADAGPDTSTETVGPWTQCTTDAECQTVLGEAGYCNLAFPGGQCQGCDPSDFLACQGLGHDGLTLTCREMAPTVCLFDCPCPSWLRCLESEQLCILKTCSSDAECGPFACRPISAGGTSYCLPAE